MYDMFCNAVEIVFLCLSLIPYNEFYVRQLTQKKKFFQVNLQEQGRLLRQDEFLVYHGRRKFMRHVFLFEDLILFSKTRRSRSGFQNNYVYKFSFKVTCLLKGVFSNFVLYL